MFCGALLCLAIIRVTIYSTLSVGMLGGGLVWGLVGVPFRRLVGVLVGRQVVCVLVVGSVGVLSSNLD
jgi:hypothetical protein